MIKKRMKVVVAMFLCVVLCQSSLVGAAALTTYDRNVVILGHSTMETTFTSSSDKLYVNAKIHQGTQGFSLKIEGVQVNYSFTAYFPYYTTRPDAVFNLEKGQKYRIILTTDGAQSVYTTITFKC